MNSKNKKPVSEKDKSAGRFTQLNHIVDVVAPTLRTSSQVAVLLCCFRHARIDGSFTVSTKRIARSVKLSIRHTQRVIDDLEAMQVIVRVSEHQGPIPRRYRITGNANGSVAD